MSPQETGEPAVLIADSQGILLGANSAALKLLRADAGALIGRSAASLFEFDVVSNEPDILAAQWDALRENASTSAAEMMLKPQDESAVSPVRVRIESVAGGAREQFFIHLGPLDKAGGSRTGDGFTEGNSRADQAPDLEARRWLALVNQGGAGFFDLDFKEGQIRYAPAWKKMLGYVDSELPDTYDTWMQLIHPDDSGAAPDKMGHKKGTSGAQPFSIEFRMKHRLGHWVWIQCLGVRFIDEQGEIQRVVGLHLDISERKEIEEACMANDERMRLLCEDGPLGAFEFDFASGSAWLSPRWKSLVGYEPGEMPDTADSFLHSLPEQEKESGLQYWFGSMVSGSTSSILSSTKLRHKEGRWIPVVVGAQCHFSRKRELLRVVGFCCEVPQTLSATSFSGSTEGVSEAMLRDAFGSLAEGVLIANSKGHIAFANATALRLLQRPAEQVMDHPASEVFLLVNVANGKPSSDDVCEQAISSDGPLPINNQHALAAPKTELAMIPIVWTARAVFGSGGRPEGVVVVFRNPEEMSLTPEELVKANRYESLALLAGGIAHDFNNLLTTILGGISVAKDTKDSSTLDDSEKSCLAAKALTKQLLAFAKGGAGVRSVVASPDILQDSVKIAAAGATIEVTVQATEGVSPVQVDRSQILQVFQNLIVNSIQAMPPAPHKGVITLRVDPAVLAENQMPPLPGGAYVRFEVRDNGSGIKPENLERIWDPFFTTKKHGTGLGLATVLSIVRKHGGQIGVQSELGVGTVFTVFLPAASEPVEVQARRAPSLRYGTGRILFMDDDPKISAITANMLQSLEYKFDLAKNGEEAIKLYRSYLNIGRPYDVVLMDLTVIGGMGGEDAFKAMKELDPDVRAIACSGYDNDDMARRFLDMGFCGYLTKPYRVGDLGKVIKTVIG
ncbi:MAG: PAS domain-containing protein [Opitutaceae bacterium]